MDVTRKILVVDDEVKIVEVLESYLEHNNFKVFKAYSGREAIQIFEKESPDLIILDLMLPDMSGEEVCKHLRKQSRIPIIMLTAKVTEDEILNGLDIGADDYVLKPFSPKQVIARVNTVLRRSALDVVPMANILTYGDGDLCINTLKYEVSKKGENVKLTPNEYNILLTLIKYPDKTFTREELISLALGEDFDGFDRAVDSHIKNLRQKIESDPKNPQYVVTVFGIGYRFNYL